MSKDEKRLVKQKQYKKKKQKYGNQYEQVIVLYTKLKFSAAFKGTAVQVMLIYSRKKYLKTTVKINVCLLAVNV